MKYDNSNSYLKTLYTSLIILWIPFVYFILCNLFTKHNYLLDKDDLQGLINIFIIFYCVFFLNKSINAFHKIIVVVISVSIIILSLFFFNF